MFERIEASAIIKKKTLGLVFALSAASFAFAQQKLDISGRILDKQNNPVPYASITFSNPTNKAFSDAVLTDEKGNYKLQLVPGNYSVSVEAIDYKKATSSRQISVAGALGNIILEKEKSSVQTQDIQGVVITANTRPVKVELDKKTYDVKSDITAIGGNLQDVLQNVPSVSVDPDGTVSVRGNSNVKFLIDGKPSALLGIDDGANALQAIPADQIDRIEVITNPSAKFDASGTAGILNIILKKDKKSGFNGSVVGSLGYLPKTSLNANLGWRKGNFNWFLNGGGSYNRRTSNNWNDNQFFPANSNGNIREATNSESKGENNSYNLSTGFLYNFNDKTSVNASGTIRTFEMINSQPIQYTYYPQAGEVYNGLRSSDGRNTNLGFQGDFGLDHKFDDKGQNISLALSLQSNTSKGNTDTEQYMKDIFQLANLTDQNTVNKSIVGKVDYELPIGEQSVFNAGYKIDDNHNVYDFTVKQKGVSDPDFSILPRYTNDTNYKETIQALYVQFKSKIGNIGYQLGLRDELSNISIDYQNLTGVDNIISKKNYNNLFPSVFLSYDFAKNNQLLVNYSRRINRPRSFFLVPFFSYSDNQNIFKGNPNLDPSYVDSFEFGYNYTKGKWMLNPTLYYRNTHDDVKMAVSYGYDNFENQFVFTTQPFNIGGNQQYGLDFNFNYDPFTWLKLMGEADVFRYKSTGDYSYSYPDPANPSNTITQNLNFDGSGTSTRLRLSSTFKFDKTFSLQLMGNYRGPQNNGASSTKSMYFVNLGATKTIWNGDGTLALSVQDIFNTRGRHSISTGPNYVKESFMQWSPRQVSLSLTYRFKQGAKIEQSKKKKDFNSDTSGGDDQQPPM